MLHITLICVGKMKEKHYIDAAAEYVKRLGAWCRTEICELNEVRLPEAPSAAELDAALRREAETILAKLPRGASTVALCVEGEEQDSVRFSRTVQRLAKRGAPGCALSSAAPTDCTIR
jgi:23S rRNA (pseudouridine1915-N3)-methyltransferase